MPIEMVNQGAVLSPLQQEAFSVLEQGKRTQIDVARVMERIAELRTRVKQLTYNTDVKTDPSLERELKNALTELEDTQALVNLFLSRCK